MLKPTCAREDVANGFGSYQFENGSIFTGEWRSGLLHGKGHVKTSEYEFVGEFMSGLRHGHGEFWSNTKDGTTFVGAFVEDKRDGFGVELFRDGSYVHGNWQKDCLNGEAVWVLSPTSQFSGMFVNNLRHGPGTLRIGETSFFCNTWTRGKLNGDVVVTLADGTKHHFVWNEGRLKGTTDLFSAKEVSTSCAEFVCGRQGVSRHTTLQLLPCGSRLFAQSDSWCRMVHIDGTVYVGDHLHGQKHGYGVETRNSEVYEGGFFKNKRHGQGVLTKPHKSFAGRWVNGEMTGFADCEMNFSFDDEPALKTTYVGELKRGKRHGLGKLVLSNGSSYEGEWSEDAKHGFGTFQDGHGAWYRGDWAFGAQHGFGTSHFSDGSVHIGEYFRGLPHGPGEQVSPCGTCCKGNFSFGTLNGLTQVTYSDGSSSSVEHVMDYVLDVNSNMKTIV